MRCFLLSVLAFCFATVGLAFAVPCSVVAEHSPSEAESAYLHGDFDQAAGLYRAQLQQHPDDAEAVVGLTRALLRGQKVDEAAGEVNKALAASPKSGLLSIALAEVEYRQGTPWLAAATANQAMHIVPCNPRLHLLLARIYRLNSMYASSAKELRTAHALDPHDPAIRRWWIDTLSASERISELEAYLAAPTGDGPEDIHLMQLSLESLKKRAEEPHKPCRLVSSSTSTEIPFAQIMRDATHIRAFGLEVKLNGHGSHLQIDTGASGLLVSRPVAEHAGLKPFSATEMSGIGSEGITNGYTAYADSIQIGSLEFHDCVVRVMNARNVIDSDGLIGMDVFSRFLVTLDYPMRRLALAPLPPRPEDTTPQAPSLATGEDADDETAGKAAGSDARNPAAAAAPPHSPHAEHDRYIAPEMKDYTPVYRLGHSLLLPTVVNQGEQKLFILDTGAWTTTISTTAAREVSKISRNDQLHVHGISGKVDQAYTASDVTLHFANIRQPATEILSLDLNHVSKNAGLEVSGFLGAKTLSQLTTHIDYRDGLIKFDYDPNRGYRTAAR